MFLAARAERQSWRVSARRHVGFVRTLDSRIVRSSLTLRAAKYSRAIVRNRA
jgi:hypothetical protein